MDLLDGRRRIEPNPKNGEIVEQLPSKGHTRTILNALASRGGIMTVLVRNQELN